MSQYDKNDVKNTGKDSFTKDKSGSGVDKSKTGESQDKARKEGNDRNDRNPGARK